MHVIDIHIYSIDLRVIIMHLLNMSSIIHNNSRLTTMSNITALWHINFKLATDLIIMQATCVSIVCNKAALSLLNI